MPYDESSPGAGMKGRGKFLHSTDVGEWNDLTPPLTPLIARFMGPTWGPSGADRTQVGPMLAPWTLLFGTFFWHTCPHYESVTSTMIYKFIAIEYQCEKVEKRQLFSFTLIAHVLPFCKDDNITWASNTWLLYEKYISLGMFLYGEFQYRSLMLPTL